MAEVIRMPKMSDTMEEGVIAAWLKKVGEKVNSGDILAEVETDKATMELESYEDGVLLHIGIEEKQSVPVDGVIAIIGEKGEDIEGILNDIKTGGTSSSAPQETASNSQEAEDKVEDIDTSAINATVITMPKMSDTMTEGVIASWLKKVGDNVKSGDLLAEVETDKATMELESYEDGVLLYTAVEPGNGVPVDDVIAIIGEKGADYETLLKANKNQKSAPPSNEDSKAETVKSDNTPAAKKETVASNGHASASNGRIKASPLAKKIAKEKGYNLAQIQGTGEGGRIVKKDVDSFTPSADSPTKDKTASSGSQTITLPQVVGEERYTDEPVSQMRKVIAKKVAESKFTSPHFYVTMEINMDEAITARKSMNEISPVKISFNDMVVKAAAAALKKHPAINSSWLGDKIRINEHVNIGIAMALDYGLFIPVVRFADTKSMSHISAEIKQYGAKAKEKKLQPSDWEGSTFTISNLGMFGVDEFTGIINAPDSCILAVGGIKETPIVKNGQIVPGNLMKVTLSCDHRSVDGAIAAAFLQTLKNYLEDPIRLLV